MTADETGNIKFAEKTINKIKYLTILKRNLKPSIEKFQIPSVYHAQQDNDSKYTSRVVIVAL